MPIKIILIINLYLRQKRKKNILLNYFVHCMEIIINSWVWIRFDWSKVHGGNKDIGLFTEKNMTSKNKNIKKKYCKEHEY